jgi:hypothetical protein
MQERINGINIDIHNGAPALAIQNIFQAVRVKELMLCNEIFQLNYFSEQTTHLINWIHPAKQYSSGPIILP